VFIIATVVVVVVIYNAYNIYNFLISHAFFTGLVKNNNNGQQLKAANKGFQ